MDSAILVEVGGGVTGVNGVDLDVGFGEVGGEQDGEHVERSLRSAVGDEANLIVRPGGSAMEQAALANQGGRVHEMMEAIVEAFVRAKFAADKRASAALYQESSEVDGAALSRRLSRPMVRAQVAMFRTASDRRVSELDVKVELFFAAMAGVVRAQFESSGPKLSQVALRKHLVELFRLDREGVPDFCRQFSLLDLYCKLQYKYCNW